MGILPLNSPAGGKRAARPRLRFAPLLLVFEVFVLLLGAAAAASAIAAGGELNMRLAALLALLVCVLSCFEFRCPGSPLKMSAAPAVAFAAIAVGAPLLALILATVALICRLPGAPASERDLGTLGVRLATVGCCVVAASSVYSGLISRVALGWLATSLVATAVWFIVESAFESLRKSLATAVSPFELWRSEHFWTLPAYGLYPLAAGLTQFDLAMNSPLDLALGLGLGVLIAGCVMAYFRGLRRREERAQKLEQAHEHAIEALAATMTATERVQPAGLSRIKGLAERLGQRLNCTEPEIQALKQAAVLRDVGKVVVPEAILNKPGRLTPEEFEAVAAHSEASAAILEQAAYPEAVQEAVLAHHEHWDGSGYPRALSGGQIPRLARLLAVLDCYDALVSDRPYRAAFSADRAASLIRQQSGRMFDPEVVEAFLAILPATMEAAAARPVKPHGQKSVSPPVQQSWRENAGQEAELRRRDTLRRLIASPEQLVAFYDILRLLGADLNFSKTLTESLEILRRALPCDKAGVFVERNGRFVLQHGSGFPDHCLSRLAVSTEFGFTAEALSSRVPVIGEGPPSLSAQGKAPRYLDDVRSTLAAPLLAEEKVVGVLVMCSLASKAFDPSQTAYLSLITEKMASTVVSSRTLEKIYREAETDAITKLPNVRAAFRRLEDEIQRAARQNQPLAVLFVDVDELKPVNDTYGHGAGDRLLAEVARKMRSYLRSYDFLARVGGDEFLAIVPGISRAGVEGKVEALKQAVQGAAVQFSESTRIIPSVSIGAAVFPDDAADAEELIYLSDQRMYQDKQRNRRANEPLERIMPVV